METHHVNPAVITVWRLQGVLFALFILIGPVVVWMLFPQAWLVVPVVCGMVVAVSSWLYPPAYYRNLQYGVDATGIVIRHGVFWRSHAFLPRVRIQHTDVSQGPLERRYGVSTLKLYTAGSRYTKIELPGLAHGEALALRDSLTTQHSAQQGTASGV